MAGALLLALAVGFALLRTGQLSMVGGVRLSAPWVLEDFRLTVYYPTRAFWEGENPYESGNYLSRYPVSVPFPVYAPATFLVYLPLGLLPLPAASVAYFILTITLTVLVGLVALRASGAGTSAGVVMAIAGLILLSRPGHWNLLLGQVTLAVVLASYVAILYARQRPLAAGAAIALALLKPTFGIPLSIILAAVGAWRPVLLGVGLAAAVNLPLTAVLMHRAGGFQSFVSGLLESQARFALHSAANPLTSAWRIDVPALISRTGGHLIGTAASSAIGAAVLPAAILGLRRVAWSPDPRGNRVWTGIACCAVLLGFYHQVYDLLLLVLPAVALGPAWRLGLARRSVLLGQAILFAFLATNYMATRSVLDALEPGPVAKSVLLSLNTLALLVLYGLYLYEAWAPTTINHAPLPPDSRAVVR